MDEWTTVGHCLSWSFSLLRLSPGVMRAFEDGCCLCSRESEAVPRRHCSSAEATIDTEHSRARHVAQISTESTTGKMKKSSACRACVHACKIRLTAGLLQPRAPCGSRSFSWLGTPSYARLWRISRPPIHFQGECQCVFSWDLHSARQSRPGQHENLSIYSAVLACFVARCAISHARLDTCCNLNLSVTNSSRRTGNVYCGRLSIAISPR